MGMGDYFARPKHHFPEDSTPNSAIFKQEDPKQASHSLEIHLYEIEYKWSDTKMISFNGLKPNEFKNKCFINKEPDEKCHVNTQI